MNLLDIEYTGLDGKVKKLGDVISAKDIFMIEGVNKPIIMKQGINAIRKAEGIRVRDYKITALGSDAKTCLISAIAYLSTDGINTLAAGYGEAAPQLNLESEISGNYPQALAVKRAVSQGVLETLAIDAYSDIDSPDFDRKKPVRIDDLPDSLKVEIGATYAKRILLDRIKSLLKEASEDKKEIIRNKMGAKAGGKIDLANTTIDTLLDIVIELGR